MAARVLLQRRAVAPLTATLLAGGIVLYPSVAHAEAPTDYRSKKPIYDYDDLDAAPAKSNPSAPPASPEDGVLAHVLPPPAPAATAAAGPAPSHRRPTPTDRLAAQIRVARLFLHGQASRAEDAVNAAMDRAFDLERSFTGTVASLAPPRESGERLVPGLVYVLVAAMAGTVVSRRRGVVVRAAAPLALGLGAAWVVLPVTMGNVSELAWRYEQRFPAVADAHKRAREGVETGVRFVKVHADLAVRKVDETVVDARETVEGWVRKGK